MHSLKNPQSTVILALACASFFGLGVINAAIGPALPELAGNTGSTLAAVGSLFSGMFFGSLAAQVFTGPLLDRLGPRWPLMAGLTMVGAGITGVAFARALPAALASAFLTGLGYGVIALIINVTVSNLFPHRRASALNLINMFFGIGAFIAPAIAGLSLRLSGSSLTALWLGGGLEILLLPFFFRRFSSNQQDAAEPGEPLPAGKTQFLRSPVLWILSLMLLVYIGTENGASGWVTTYMLQTTPLAAANAALAASAFWLAFTAGRMLGALLGVRWSTGALLKACLSIALLGGLLIVASTGNTPLSFLGFVLLGLGLGPTFPTTLAVITAAFPGASGSATSLAMAVGFVGGMVIPWLLGVIMEAQGPRVGALLLPLGALIMLDCLAAAQFFHQRQAGKDKAANDNH